LYVALNVPASHVVQSTPETPYLPGTQAGVGAAVGAAVGFAVGAAVGKAVGYAVGVSVGAAVGYEVGAAVGTAVGYAVGAAVGEAVGYAVGVSVGEAVGYGVTAWRKPRLQLSPPPPSNLLLKIVPHSWPPWEDPVAPQWRRPSTSSSSVPQVRQSLVKCFWPAPQGPIKFRAAQPPAPALSLSAVQSCSSVFSEYSQSHGSIVHTV